MKYADFYPSILSENRKLAKELVVQGKLTPEEFAELESIDPSTTKKYMGWMAKQVVNKSTSGITTMDDLRNTVEEYDTFVKNGKAKTKDIFQFPSFKELKNEVDTINRSGPESKSELRDDYEIIRDDDQFIIAVPHSHEASRYLGLSKFSYRDCEGGGKDSAWCTTYKAPDHFNDYYFSQGITLYYIRVKSPELIEKVKAAFPEYGPTMVVVALLVDKNGKLFDGYNADDEKLTPGEITKFRRIIGL
jgi:DNA-binding CsgD family transcriptional regulator